MLTPEQAMQAAISKNVKLVTPSNVLPVKHSLASMPSGINSGLPQNQDAQKPFLHLPPSPLSPVKLPPLPHMRPPLPIMPPPPPPPPNLPPPPPAPNQILIAQGVTQLPPPPMQPPPPIRPASYHMYPSYSPLHQNAARSFANTMFTQPPNLITTGPGQYRSHDTMANMFSGEPVSSRTPYSESYSQRETVSQQQSQPPSSSSFTEFEMQEESRQNYNETRVFNRDGVFVGGSYSNNGSQQFGDSGQHYSDAAYQQFRGNVPNKRLFTNRSSRPPIPPPQYQNRQIRNHPYQRR